MTPGVPIQLGSQAQGSHRDLLLLLPAAARGTAHSRPGCSGAALLGHQGASPHPCTAALGCQDSRCCRDAPQAGPAAVAAAECVLHMPVLVLPPGPAVVARPQHILRSSRQHQSRQVWGAGLAGGAASTPGRCCWHGPSTGPIPTLWWRARADRTGGSAHARTGARLGHWLPAQQGQQACFLSSVCAVDRICQQMRSPQPDGGATWKIGLSHLHLVQADVQAAQRSGGMDWTARLRTLQQDMRRPAVITRPHTFGKASRTRHATLLRPCITTPKTTH